MVAIVLVIGVNAFIGKKRSFTSSTDLIFCATSTCANVEDETKYSSCCTSQYICPSTTKIIACKLLAVDDKYTHIDAEGCVVLNTGTPGVVSAGNPDGEEILTVHAVHTTGSYCKIDYLTKSDVGGGTTHFDQEGVDFENGGVYE